MKFSLLIFFSFTFAMFSYGQFEESEAIDAIFEEWNKTDAPGCGLGIIKDGKMIYGRGYGMANLEYDIPNSNNSVFRIGSTSKQFTAACIVLLAEKGKLNLDDKLNTFFPEFPEYAKKISVRHLLNHTSGVRDYLTISYLKGYTDDEYYTDEDLMKWLVNQDDLNFEPGEEFLYSNSGYWLLGQIVEKVSGKNMADYAKGELFTPLGMNNTHFHNNHNEIVKNRASGYTPTGENSYQISMTTLDMIGDGGIFTSVNDIKKWEDSFYDTSVLSKNFWGMMTQQGVLNNGEVIEYASGLDISEYKGLKTISHGGAFVGFRAEILRFPEHKMSIAIFANRADANPTRMAYGVADILLEKHFDNSLESNPSIDENKKVKYIKLSSKKLEKFTGQFWNNADSYSRKIYVRNDTLRYFRNETNESALLPISKNEFRMQDVGNADVLVKFEGEENLTMIIDINQEETISFEEYESVQYTVKELSAFAGDYYSKELDVQYSLKMEEDFLVLYVDKQQVSPMESIMEDHFVNSNFGDFQFTRDANGKLI
ncbi:MAG: serine hydrolase domain-containing protein, partial [Flavobacteriales bacterium]